jgi:hypothetical protein
MAKTSPTRAPGDDSTRPTDSAWKSDAATPPDRNPLPEGVQRLTGRGVVRRGGQQLGEVDYDITITPPNLRGSTFEPGFEPKVSADITGRLMGPLYQAEDLVHGIHTLVLEDGREFDFRVLQPETNEIIGVSWFRSSPMEGTRSTQRS